MGKIIEWDKKAKLLKWPHVEMINNESEIGGTANITKTPQIHED